MKTNKALIAFAVVYNIMLLIAILETEPLTIVILFPVFFLLSATALSVLYHHKAIQTNTLCDKMWLLFSTPVPLLILCFGK